MLTEPTIAELQSKLHEARQAAAAVGAGEDAAEVARLTALISKELGPFPIPPVHLRMHVGLRSQASNWLGQGRASSKKVRELFGASPTAPVLDWGCGSGRTLWWLMRDPAWAEHYRGGDVDAEAIAWLRKAGVTTVTHITDRLPYENGSMAGVFSFSVLTHIHPLDFPRWLSELARVTAPGGRVYLTFNGEAALQATNDGTLLAAYSARGWAWREHEGHFKSAAYVAGDHMMAECCRFFEVSEIRSKDYAMMDAILCKVP
jgi:SAM-dependent methyltransferase